jgi:hypothetical protein
MLFFERRTNMEKFRHTANIVVICLVAVVLLVSSAQAKPASVQLQEGLYAEEIEGDLDAAIKIYEEIAADKSADSRYAAQAGLVLSEEAGLPECQSHL